jgi:glutathione S-transferase
MYERLINPLMLGIPTDQKVVGESLEKLKKVLKMYEAHLSKHTFLAGNFVSFSDLNHFTYTFFHGHTPRGPL